jgi:hypothetical protein
MSIGGSGQREDNDGQPMAVSWRRLGLARTRSCAASLSNAMSTIWHTRHTARLSEG